MILTLVLSPCLIIPYTTIAPTTAAITLGKNALGQQEGRRANADDGRRCRWSSRILDEANKGRMHVFYKNTRDDHPRHRHITLKRIQYSTDKERGNSLD